MRIDLPGAQAVTCPRCGGELEFARQPITGHTTERCIRHPSLGTPAADACHHLRVLEHRSPIVVVDETPVVRGFRSARATGPRAETRAEMSRVLAALPTTAAAAASTPEIAGRLKLHHYYAERLLRLLYDEGKVDRTHARRVGQRGRAPARYWRVA